MTSMTKVFTLILLALMTTMVMRGDIVATFEYQQGVYYPAVIPLPLNNNGVSLSLYGSIGPMGLIFYSSRESKLTSSVGPIKEIQFQNCNTSFTFSIGASYTAGNNVVWTGRPTDEVSFVPTEGSNRALKIVVIVDDTDNQGQHGLGDMSSMESGDKFTSAYPATVLWHSNSRLYIKDETGYGLIYGNVGRTYRQGDVIPAGWGGTVFYDIGQPLLTPPFHGFVEPINHVEVIPEEITAAQIDHAHWAHYVVARELTIDPTRDVLIDKDGNKIPYYNLFGVALPTDMTAQYTFYGIVGEYGSVGNTSHHLLITDYEPKPGVPEVDCLEDLFQQPQNQTVYFKSPLAVIYQNEAYLYVRDKHGRDGLIYGRTAGGPFVNGDSIVGYARWTTHGNTPELMALEPWDVVGHGPLQQPKRIDAIEDVKTDWAHMYVQFSGVSVYHDNESLSYIMSDETDEMALFNRFNITIPTFRYPDVAPTYDDEPTISTVMNLINYILTGGPVQSDGTAQHPWKNCYVAGFLGVFKGNLELYPTVVNTEAIQNYDINGDGEINIADVNVLINNIINY